MYSEQFEEGLRPWQPKKLYFSGAQAGPGGAPGGGRGGRGGAAAQATPAAADAAKLTPVATDTYDPLLGRTCDAEIGSDAHSYHKCQGVGGTRRRWSRWSWRSWRRWRSRRRGGWGSCRCCGPWWLGPRCRRRSQSRSRRRGQRRNRRPCSPSAALPPMPVAKRSTSRPRRRLRRRTRLLARRYHLGRPDAKAGNVCLRWHRYQPDVDCAVCRSRTRRAR